MVLNPMRFIARQVQDRPPPDDIEGVTVRFSARARRFSLRTDARTGGVVLVWPPKGDPERARAFVRQHQAWISRKHQRTPEQRHFSDGSVFSILGQPCRISRQAGRGLTQLNNGVLTVRGHEQHINRRVRNFIKHEAEKIFSDRIGKKAGGTPFSLRVADPRTRWGSCAVNGRIMLSWRLLLAPVHVLDYVIAHEVAHLTHRHHRKPFWDLCRSLCDDMDGAKAWLKEHGASLMVWI